MKRILFFTAAMLLAGFLHAANDPTLEGREYNSYQDTGQEKSLTWTTSASSGTISTCTIPSWANGFRIRPASTAVRFSVRLQSNTSDVAVSTQILVGLGAITENQMGRGGIALADEWTTRLLPFRVTAGTAETRTLYVISAGGSIAVQLEFF